MKGSVVSWNAVPLNEVCNEIIDCINKTAPSVDFETPYKMIRTTNIKEGRVNLDIVRYVTESTFIKWTRRSKLKLNDVILTREAPLGEIGLLRIDDTVFLGQRTMVYRSNSNILAQLFLYYSFLSFPLQSQIRTLGSGSTVEHLRVPHAEKLLIPLPPLPIQKKIAAVLSAYDDLIENNNRRIAILEKMAEELYREWFVRLRFPGHENTKIGKGIPEGWEVKKIGDLGRVVTGKTPPTNNQSFYNGIYPFIKTPDMHESMFVYKTFESLSEAGFKYQKSQIVPKKSICVSCIGSGGVVAITTVTSQTNQQINTVILKNLKHLEWTYFAIKSMKETIELFGYTGATMTNLSKGKFEKLKILHPNEDLIFLFHSKIEKIFDEILIYHKQNNVMKSSRDRLLSRLMGGKIDVENIDIWFPSSMKEVVNNE